MNISTIHIALLISGLILVSFGHTDEVFLKNGGRISGSATELDSIVIVKFSAGTTEVMRSEVDSVVYNNVGKEKRPRKSTAIEKRPVSYKSPIETVALHLKYLNNSAVKSCEVPIYTQASREFFRKHPAKPYQTQNEINYLTPALPYALQKTKGSRAVVRFPARFKGTAPFLLRMVGGQWKIDFMAMRKYLRFDTNNHWLMFKKDHTFMFAFEGGILDDNGYPVK